MSHYFIKGVKHTVLLFLMCYCYAASGQTAKSDFLIQKIIQSQVVSAPQNEGVQLMKSGNFGGAGTYFTAQINSDPSNTSAYLNRGVTQWKMNEPENACRDWSALLALGDTAAFNLLDAKCHGIMVIDDDTLKKHEYRKIFAPEKKDAKTLSSNSGAMSIADEMPRFPGGDAALLEYLNNHIQYPVSVKNKKVQGIVVVNFVISSKGKVLYPYIKKGLDPECDKEALRLISSLPPWIPANQQGKPVLVRYNIPVSFNLK